MEQYFSISKEDSHFGQGEKFLLKKKMRLHLFFQFLHFAKNKINLIFLGGELYGI